jgi:hypothetical protein
MNDQAHLGECRHFLTYTGVKLPLKMMNPLEDADIANRNTYFRAYYDEQGRMVLCQKVVYSEVELEHRYEYYNSGILKRVEIIETDDDPKIMCFDEVGNLTPN